MKALIIYNTVITSVIVCVWLYKTFLSRFLIEVNRTFWYKIPYSATLYYKTAISKNGGYSATGIFTLSWRNFEKAEALDNLYFNQKKPRK